MQSLFKNIGLVEFEKFFSSEGNCLEYLSEEKWKGGFVCRKCGHTNYCKGKKVFSRRCTKCKSEESATAHTIFHKCKFPITEAFKITYLVCHNPEISSYRLSDNIHLRQMTCWKFKKKIDECLRKNGEIEIIEKQIVERN
jgi:hypothetical protein